MSAFDEAEKLIFKAIALKQCLRDGHPRRAIDRRAVEAEITGLSAAANSILFPDIEFAAAETAA